ncbi:hypothetical protein VMUT_0125 [Vulcanisaeta moutnovskia 768-28]|uniref:Uncharacterized protein n=2 Tax=Thermoproteaceae TaxID=2267 RepID=F0QSJ0_VULM7|nr:hypothetical protein VMUT_0125 [Vulcanisaeta moutnovskia 768-28]
MEAINRSLKVIRIKMVSKAVMRFIEELLNPYSIYYSDGVLNSEGMTLLKVIAREVLREYPNLKSRFAKARRRRDYEYVSGLLNDVISYLSQSSR